MRKWRTEVLLLLPACALAALAAVLPRLQAKPKSTLTLRTLKVTPIVQPKTSSQFSNPVKPDVSVLAEVNYHQSVLDHHFDKKFSISIPDAYIVDGRGKKYYWHYWAPSAKKSISPDSFGMGHATYEFDLDQFPKSVGSLTLKLKFVASDGYIFPILAVIRK